MSERKVIQKYYPPNFDPSKIPRRRLGKDVQHKVRLMTPFSMRCNSCGEYIYKGKKFNARKETVHDELYLTIKIFRFYIRCSRCSAEITFKTDPSNLDYVAEHGAQRNFEPWRDNDVATDEQKVRQMIEEEMNPMRALENKTESSKRELDIMDALDEIRMRNARAEKVNVDSVLDRIVTGDRESEQQAEADEEAELDRLAKAAFRSAALAKLGVSAVPTTDNASHLHSFQDDDDNDGDDPGDGDDGDAEEEIDLMALLHAGTHPEDGQAAVHKRVNHFASEGLPDTAAAKKRKATAADFGIVAKKPAAAKPAPTQQQQQAKPTTKTTLVADYGSDSSDET
ncbi:Pre-mRNA-splicing factor cwf16 [Sorochytrium milnesiophthora]